jgi:hypothetical protein
MPFPRERSVRVLFGVGWLGGLALALWLGAAGRDVRPGQLIGLLLAIYLGAWGLVFFRSRWGPMGNAARFLACTASILVAVEALEASALFHLVDYRSIFQSPTAPWERPRNRPDPDLLYTRAGHQRVRKVMTGNDIARLHGAKSWKIYHCDLRYDRDGFRNRSDLDSADLIVLGDSFIEGMQMADAELITARLAVHLDRTVANLGRTGDGPQQELHILRRYGLGLRPRTCIWAFYEGNDLQDARRYEPGQEAVRRFAQQGGSPAFGALSFTMNWLEYLIRTRLSPEPRPAARLYIGRFVDHTGKQVDMYFGSEDQHDESVSVGSLATSPELKRVQSQLAEAHSLCRRQGIQLVVMFIPSKFRVYRDLCTFDRDSPCLAWPDNDLPRALKAKLDEISAEISFLDLTPRFHAEAARGSLIYLPDDTHWSSEGHRVAAQELAGFLRAHPATQDTENGISSINTSNN